MAPNHLMSELAEFAPLAVVLIEADGEILPCRWRASSRVS